MKPARRAPASRLATLCLAAASALSAAACSSEKGATGDGGAADAGASGDAASTVVATTCAGREALSGDLRWTLTVGGLERIVKVHLPPNYDPAVGMPVVLNFHGLGSNADQQIFYSKMGAKADSAGFIAVHAEGTAGTGTRQSWNAGYCCDPAMSANVDDVGFVRAMLDELEAKLCVDPARIFSTGMSNGGFMSHRLGCELSERIAAIAPVAGMNYAVTCAPTRKIPVMHFHGTADQTVPYTSSTPGAGVIDSLTLWAERNGCQTTRHEIFKMGDGHCETFDGCPSETEVTVCTVEGGGHTWPGAVAITALGHTSMDVKATDMMWDFFMRHPLPTVPKN